MPAEVAAAQVGVRCRRNKASDPLALFLLCTRATL